MDKLVRESNATEHPSSLGARLRRALGVLGVWLLSTSLVGAQTETVTYIHTDLFGSPLAGTGAAGELLWKENYQPYGARFGMGAGAANNVRFHGKPVDQTTGLSEFGARWYDGQLGRFMGVDPAGFSEANLHSFNRYAYGNNNAYKYVDPDGEAAAYFVVIAVVGAVLIGGGYFAHHNSLGSQPGLVPPTAQTATPGFVGGAWAGVKEALGDPGGFVAWTRDKMEGLVLNKSDSATDTASNENQGVTKRPSRVRKGTEQGNWDNAQDGAQGGKVCPTYGTEVMSKPGSKAKDWDNDHTPPWRDRDLRGRTRGQVLEEYNRDTRLRCVACNRSDNGR